MTFLDETGLTKLWDKIKAYIDSKGLDSSIQTAQFTSSAFSLTAGTAKSVEIPVSGLDDATILGAYVYAVGGSPVMTSVNAITNTKVTAYVKCDIALTNRILKAQVFYKVN